MFNLFKNCTLKRNLEKRVINMAPPTIFNFIFLEQCFSKCIFHAVFDAVGVGFPINTYHGNFI